MSQATSTRGQTDQPIDSRTADVTKATLDYRAIALDYLDKGWNPLPLPVRVKEPPPKGFTGESGRSVSVVDINTWTEQGRWGNVAIRVPGDVIGIDVDHYGAKAGDDHLVAAERQLGPLPATYASTSRPGTKSGIYFYRVPIGSKWNDKPFPDVDVIQHGHRYAVVAPSIHPTGNPYRWYDPTGEEIDTPPAVDDLTELPWSWIEHLRASSTATTPPIAQLRPSTTRTMDERHPAVKRVVEEWHATKHGGRHDALNHAVLALTRLDSQGYPGAVTARHDVATDFYNLVTSDGTRTEDQARAEVQRSVDGAKEVVMTTASTIPSYEPSDPVVFDWATGEIITRPVTSASGADNTLALPEEFFDARPIHAHVRDAARSRRVSPTAAFVHLLARIAAATPPSYCVPPFVGSTAPLTLYVAQVSMSGQGKSSAVRLVDDLLPGLDRPVPLGSGEGFAESYFGDVKENEDGKAVTKKRQIRYGMAFELDEGSALADLAARSGSTILPVLRTAWSGSTLGNTNASADKRRQLPAGNYAAGLTLLFQPTNARPLFDDVGGGLPQRFLFVRAGDPNNPTSDTKPDFPGPINWQPLPIIAIEH
ncbi:MAG: bifunctional DNA primase/polymerase, partial [Actinobacteria bacterium]|nr:bifunctional DNA primase/polymerase [Actinomycetota bacterium]